MHSLGSHSVMAKCPALLARSRLELLAELPAVSLGDLCAAALADLEVRVGHFGGTRLAVQLWRDAVEQVGRRVRVPRRAPLRALVTSAAADPHVAPEAGAGARAPPGRPSAIRQPTHQPPHAPLVL